MKKHAIIDSNNVVQNVVLWDGVSEWKPPEGHTVIEIEEITCNLGWTYENGTFVAPSPPTEEIK